MKFFCLFVFCAFVFQASKGQLQGYGSGFSLLCNIIHLCSCGCVWMAGGAWACTIKFIVPRISFPYLASLSLTTAITLSRQTTVVINSVCQPRFSRAGSHKRGIVPSKNNTVAAAKCRKDSWQKSVNCVNAQVKRLIILVPHH